MLELKSLKKSYGALCVTDNLSVAVAQGELRAIIGPNGAGKTSLIAQIAGELRSDSGIILFGGRDITRETAAKRCVSGISRTYQISSLFKTLSVFDNVRIAVQAHKGHSYRFLRDSSREEELIQPAIVAIDKVGLGNKLHERVGSLSHGDQRRLEIAMALAASPQILLLDEPTAGMGAEDSAQIAKLIAQLKGRMSIILIEHDMSTVFALADTITVLVRGRELVTGTPQDVRSNAEVKASYLGDSVDA